MESKSFVLTPKHTLNCDSNNYCEVKDEQDHLVHVFYQDPKLKIDAIKIPGFVLPKNGFSLTPFNPMSCSLLSYNTEGMPRGKVILKCGMLALKPLPFL